MARIANSKECMALPKSAMKTQPFPPASELLVGLKYRNNTNKFPEVISCFVVYLSHIPF
jgi:hypothetical protein